MEVLDIWEQSGLEKGLHRKAVEYVLRLLSHRFGELPQELQDAIATLPEPVLDELHDAAMDFRSLSDASAWLEQHRPPGT